MTILIITWFILGIISTLCGIFYDRYYNISYKSRGMYIIGLLLIVLLGPISIFLNWVELKLTIKQYFKGKRYF